MTYESFDVIELGKAESLVEASKPNGSTESDGSKTRVLFPLYSEMGEAEDLIEASKPNGNTESDGSKTRLMFPRYSETSDE